VSHRIPAAALIMLIGLTAGLALNAGDARADVSPRLAKALDASSPLPLAEDGTTGVWVRFADRGLDRAALAAALADAERALDPKAAARRAKMDGPVVTEGDLPLNPDYLAAVAATGARPRRVSRWLNAASFDATPAQIEAIAALPFVAEVDAVARFRKPAAEPTEAEKAAAEQALAESRTDKSLKWSHDYGGSLKGAELIDLPRAHDLGLTGRGVTIGVIDTGYDLDWHESMQHMDVVATWDFINGMEDVSDQPLRDPEQQSYHGTECLSVIGAYSPGEIVGSAWEASFVLAKTEEIDREVRLEEDNWIAALEWMEGLGVDIVSSALGYYEWYEWSDLDGGSAPITMAADLAASRGVVVLISAGNLNGMTGVLPLLAPSDGRRVITVGAADFSGRPTGSSSRGPTFDGRIKPDVLGCGSGIMVSSWWAGWIYTPAYGASYANAQVAGVAALMLQQNPGLTPLQVREALRMTASHATYPDNSYGWGVVDAYRAVGYWGPIIEHDSPVGTEDFSGPLVLEAEITSRTGVDPDQVSVYYRVSFGDWHRAGMTRVAGDLFRAELPPAYLGGYVQYYFEAADASGDVVTDPRDAPDDLYVLLGSYDSSPPQVTHYHLIDQRLADWPPVVRVDAVDDRALAGVEMTFRVNGGAEQGPFPLVEGDAGYETDFPLAAGALAVGDEVTYTVAAMDASGSANRTESGPHTFRIVDQRERILLIDDNSNAKSLEDDPPATGHVPGPATLTGEKVSADDIATWLVEMGHPVDVIHSVDVKDGTFAGYDLVVLSSGANYYPIMLEELRSSLIQYVQRGGRILVEGGEVGYNAVVAYPEFAHEVLKVAEYFDEGGYTLFQTHGLENHPLLHRPNPLPYTLELEVAEGNLVYHASDLMEAAEGTQVLYNSSYSTNIGGPLTWDDNTGPDAGQVVFYPFNFDYVKPVVARWLLENAMAYLTVREAPGPSAVTGRVLLSDATDHAGTTVSVDGYHTAVTAPDGSYVIDGLWGGSYTVTATRDGYAPRSVDFTVTDGQVVGVADITLSPMTLVEVGSTTVMAIPDNDPAGIQSDITVGQSGALQGLSVTVDISHYSINNLVVTLVSPLGTEVTLHNRTGGTADDIRGTWPDQLSVDGPGDLDDFLDEEVQGTWSLRISDNQFGATGRLNGWSMTLRLGAGPSSGAKDEIGTDTRILGNSPNPFNPRTVIAFELAKSGPVRLDVFDVRGMRVRRLVDADMDPGIHRITWDGLDDGGRATASGLYFSRLQTAAGTKVAKMLLAR